MDPSRKICIIVNPTAGHGKAQAMIPQVEALLKDCNIDFDLVTTRGPGDAVSLAAKLSGMGYSALVAMGGDGTLGEVVNGVLTSNPAMPVGAIPAGTGNDFITGNKLFSGWSEAVRALTNPRPRKFDVMLVKDAAGQVRYAVNSLGVGFDAYVAKRVSERKSKRIGRLSYGLEMLRGLFAFTPNGMKITVDGREHEMEKGWLCAVMNSEHLGGGMKVIPGAVSDDGRLHVGVLFDTPRFGLIGLLLSVYKGTHVGRRGVLITSGRQATVHAPEYYPCHIDGDIVDLAYPLTVELVPEAVTFLAGN